MVKDKKNHILVYPNFDLYKLVIQQY